MDIKELYKQRYNELKAAQKSAHEKLDWFHKEKDRVVKIAIENAKEEAIASFKQSFAKAQNDAEYELARANDELTLLRCPDERHHRRPTDNYYRCETCNFVWDDTSPAHF